MQRIRILQRIWAYTWFEPAAPEDAAAAALTATCQVKVSFYLHLSYVDIIHDNYSCMHGYLLFLLRISPASPIALFVQIVWSFPFLILLFSDEKDKEVMVKNIWTFFVPTSMKLKLLQYQFYIEFFFISNVFSDGLFLFQGRQ